MSDTAPTDPAPPHASGDIPIFPLDTVLYPEGRLPLSIFEVRYVDMTKACIRDGSVFGVCQILDGSEVGLPAVPATIGCTARIVEWDVPHAGLFALVTQGEQVFRIREQWTGSDGLIRAHVAFEPPPPPSLLLPDAAGALAKFLSEVIEKLGVERFSAPPRLEDTAWVCHRLAEVLPLDRDVKLQLLALQDPLDKLALVERALVAMTRPN